VAQFEIITSWDNFALIYHHLRRFDPLDIKYSSCNNHNVSMIKVMID
jgi:hypothetical protein